LKIKSLTLHGFKSFADRTALDFHEGITAVVGPNGCGKSNISDAIRWVLGEQRPTVIRGSRMDEAIFGGTEQRKAIHRAEVSLILSNEDGKLAVPYSEVAIGRTVYRGGESDYSLNGASCRLRDILDLCRDTGLGANAYSIIEARMIDAILSDRAEERRALFEEAAEIGRYKDRRRTALRRLEAATADLQRLDDLIGEVQAKVRSLARQRGRADRYVRYRERLLQLEIAVAGERLADIESRIGAATGELEGLRKAAPGEEAGLHAREAELETLRLRLTEDGRNRSALAEQLARVRERLNRMESEGLVEAERASTNDARLEAIEEELAEVAGRSASLSSELERLKAESEASRSRLEETGELEAGLVAEVERLEGDKKRAVTAVEEALNRHREASRQIAELSADRAVEEQRHEERIRELERRRELLLGIEESRGAAEEELEDARAEAQRAAERYAGLEAELTRVRGELAEVRARWRGVRDRVAEAEGSLSGIKARLSSLRALLASGGGQPATVRRLLGAGRGSEGVKGVLGPLVDYLDVPAHLSTAVEAHLGPYLHALLVKDWKVVAAVQRWLEQSEDEGGLLLLPLSPQPATEAVHEGSVLNEIAVRDPAGDWAAALLGTVRAAESFAPADRAWVLRDGSGQDRLGAVRVGRPGAGGSLELRAEIDTLEGQVGEAEQELAQLRSELASANDGLAEREGEVESASGELDIARAALQEADVRREAAAARVDSLLSEERAVTARIGELAGAVDGYDGDQGDREGALSGLREEEAAAEAAAGEAQERARRATTDWEAGRTELHELQLDLARLESEAAAKLERLRQVEVRRDEVGALRKRLEAEREERNGLAAALLRSAAEREEGMAALLEERSGIERLLVRADEGLGQLRAEVDEEEARVREARRAEREHAETRHALELDLAEQRARRSSIRERLEAEWAKDFESLAEGVERPSEGTLDEWARDLEELRARIRKLGPVNPLAAREYEEESERLAFLEAQREDLTKARDDLQTSIRRINRAAAESFLATFDQIRENFQRTFGTLFEGGECDLWLDSEDPLDSPIEISASPGGKRTQRIHLLSGGERALTALSLLFAIYLAKPSPFCVMDEVDAPLDEANIGRFVRMLEEFKNDTQFVVITHNPRTIEAADWIYGVTMQEPGVSSIVGVEFGDLPSGQVA
jgi:chromosome segregation protein